MKNKNIRDLTPQEMQCPPFGACPAIYESNDCIAGLACPGVYEVVELTPKEEKCIAGIGCPAAYKLRQLTPQIIRNCVVGACPEIYEANKNSYLIVGKIIDAKEFGLESRVGQGETLISIPKTLIDKMERGI